MRVLIVDDDVSILEGLETVLPYDLPDAEVTTAVDGRSAIRLMNERGPFDVVLSDLGLPDMSGIDVVVAARSQPWGRAAVVGVMSGAGEQHVDDLDFALAKPFDIFDLAQAIRSAVARRR